MEKAVKITLAITIPLLLIIACLCLAWVFSPTDFTITVQIGNETIEAINNLTEVIEQVPSDFLLQVDGLDEISNLNNIIGGLE